MHEDGAQLDISAPQSAIDLGRLGSRLWRVQQRFAATDARKKAAIKSINERFDPTLADIQAEIDALLQVIVDYAAAHKGELTSSQTLRLDSMDIEWRTDGKGTLVFVLSEDEIIARLERHKAGREHVVVKKSVRKETLKTDGITMAWLGAMVSVVFHDTVSVTTKPTVAQQRRGAKRFKRDVRL